MKKRIKELNLPLLLVSCVLFPIFTSTVTLYAQGVYIPLNMDAYPIADRYDIQYGKILPPLHTAIKPYSRKVIGEMADSLSRANITGNSRFNYNLDYLRLDNSEWISEADFRSRRPIFKVFYRDPANLYALNTEAFILKINPVFNYEIGKETDIDRHRFINSRGLEARGYIKKKLGFYAFVTDNQFRAPSYVHDRIDQFEAVPGEGYYKPFKESGVDFFTARGYISFNVIDHIDFQFGHDKNFIGNGIRSLFLSDYSNNYFFLKMNTRVWRINYQNLFCELTAQFDKGKDTLLPKKYAAFHHLNISITHFLDIGLFEGVVFRRNNNFELQYLNPVIFYRAIEQQLGSYDNSIVGMDFKLNFLQHFSLYGQFVLDEFNFSHIKSRDGWWGNKFGFQTGMKYINIAGIDNLDGQLEFNLVRPYTYTHNLSMANYTHYNQPLAHPLGANFREVMGRLRYQIFDPLVMQLQVMYAVTGLDTGGVNYGSNILISNVKQDGSLNLPHETGNKIGQGVNTKIANVNLWITYQVFHQIYFDANIIYRKQQSKLESLNSSAFYAGIGLRINLPHRNFDF